MALNYLMHRSIDHHYHPQTRTCGRVVDSEAIEQFVYFDIVATVLGKFEVDLPRQSWLQGKLPLFNQLVVCGGAVVMLLLLLAFWPKYFSGMLFSP